MQILLLILFLSTSVFASLDWPYYQIQSGDTLESISLSLYGNSHELSKLSPLKQLPPKRKYIQLPPKILRLKCNIGSAPRYLKLDYRLKQVTMVYAKNTFRDSAAVKRYVRTNSECLNDLKPWRKMQFISYAAALDNIEEKNDGISTQTKISSFAGLEYLYRREFGWVNPWVMQIRGRILKGNSAKGFSMGPQLDLEAGLGKEIRKNSQVIYGKIWRNQFDFVGNDANDYVSPYSVGATFAGLAYEYIYLHEERPWIGELGAYYQITNNHSPEVDGSKVDLSGFALRGSLKIPIVVEEVENLFIQPSWQYINYSGSDYGLFINQLALSIGMKF